MMNVPFIFNGTIVLIAFIFPAAVGTIYGYYPALQATRHDPIETLRQQE